MVTKRLAIPTALFVFALAGCGGSDSDTSNAKNEIELGYVEGTITMDGKPLPYASLNFIPDVGRPAGGMTNADGFYVLNFGGGRQGAMPGKNRVRITTEGLAGTHPDGSDYPASGETVPDKYNLQTTLVVEVKAGEKNILNFDLDSEGPIGEFAGDDDEVDMDLSDEESDSDESGDTELNEESETDVDSAEDQ